MTEQEKLLYAVLVMMVALIVTNIATHGSQFWLLLAGELCTSTSVILSLRRLRRSRLANIRRSTSSS